MSADGLPIHFLAEVKLRDSTAGGRLTPVRAGYRPQFHLPGHDSDYMMTIVSQRPDPLEPGCEGLMGIALLSWEKVGPRIQAGTEFLIREGFRVVGSGRVAEVVATP